MDRQSRLSYIESVGTFYSREGLVRARAGWKAAGRTVVFTNGCYDLLHPGHIRLLEHARTLGEILVVAIESDQAVRARPLRGDVPLRNAPARPITPAPERAEILAALAAVDYVTEFDGPSPHDFLARLLPDVVVMGGKIGANPDARRGGSDLERLGCRIVRVPLEPGYSTDLLLQRIRELRP